jgi:hypothetical protein
MTSKLLKSIGLILGTMVALLISGIFTCILIWIILSGLFLVSRFSTDPGFFTEWTWPHFLVTIVCALGIPFAWLLLSAGF